MTRTQERDAVQEACRTLAGYLPVLEDLIGEPSAPDALGPAAVKSRPAFTPEPYGDAGRALMTALEGIRRLEASLRRDVLGHLGDRRGYSGGNTEEALAMIARLASQLPDDERFARACRYLERWIADARSVHGVDENRRLRHLPRQGDPDDPAALPPRCSHCGTYFLVYDPDAGTVACTLYGCRDSDGQPPVATISTDEHGRPVLAWADGLVEAAPDLG